MGEIEMYDLPPGSRCEECGELVESKELLGEDLGPVMFLGDASRILPRRRWANRPCGHDAPAIWTGSSPTYPASGGA